MRCSRCGIGFCAVCLADCGRDAHQHCQQVHGNVYGGVDNFNRVHRVRRQREVTEFLQALPAVEAEELLQSCRRDLTLSGLSVQAIQANLNPRPGERRGQAAPLAQSQVRVLATAMLQRWRQHRQAISALQCLLGRGRIGPNCFGYDVQPFAGQLRQCLQAVSTATGGSFFEYFFEYFSFLFVLFL